MESGSKSTESPKKEQVTGKTVVAEMPKVKQDNNDRFIEGALYGAIFALFMSIAVGLGLIFISNDFTFENSIVLERILKYVGMNRPVEPGVNIAPQDQTPLRDVPFSVHFNGDGLSEGVATRTRAGWRGLDHLIEETCNKLVRNQSFYGPDFDLKRCLPSNGARLFTHEGVRCYSLNDIADGMRTYIVPQGVHFVWPLGRVGDVIVPKCVEPPTFGKPIVLRQLSMSPRVFSVENFVTPEEIQKIIEHNRELVQPSEVGFAGWRDNTRTSSTSWDYTSWAAKKIQRRAFDLVTIPYDTELADAVQVLRYKAENETENGKGEWYKPHTDWFDAKGYDGHDPTVNNGTNRFVTVFVYLSDVEEGGETVFPLSRTHEGYNGEELTHPGTENTAGYIADKDADWVCNSSSTALRTKPVAGNAVLFYSQGPDGALDKYSLHGGCPVRKGIKWSANVWIWNRNKPDKKKAKDGKPKVEPDAIHVRFKNSQEKPISIYWDDGTDAMVFQMDLAPGHQGPMQTYHGHRFVARDKETQVEVSDWRASMDKKDEDLVEF